MDTANHPARGHLAHLFLRKLQGAFALSADEEQALAQAAARTAEYAPDQDLLCEGDRPEDCNLILEGYVCRYKTLVDGKRQISSFHIPGDFCDLQSFVMQVMDHRIATLTRCKVAVYPHAAIRELIAERPRVGLALWKDTLIDAAIFREWLSNIGRRSAYARLAHLFCEMHVRMQAVGLCAGYSYEFPVTQVELGDALGLSVVHVNRTMQQLRSAGLISFAGSVVAIHDWERLREAGDFSADYLHLEPPPHPAEGSA